MSEVGPTNLPGAVLLEKPAAPPKPNSEIVIPTKTTGIPKAEGPSKATMPSPGAPDSGQPVIDISNPPGNDGPGNEPLPPATPSESTLPPRDEEAPPAAANATSGSTEEPATEQPAETTAEAPKAVPYTYDTAPPAPATPTVGTTVISADRTYVITGVDEKTGKVTADWISAEGKKQVPLDYAEYQRNGTLRLGQEAPAPSEAAETPSAEEPANTQELIENTEDIAKMSPELARSALEAIAGGTLDQVSAADIEKVRSGEMSKTDLADKLDLQIGMMKYQAQELQKKNKSKEAYELGRKAVRLQEQRDSGKIAVVDAVGKESIETIDGLPKENRIMDSIIEYSKRLTNGEAVANKLTEDKDLAFGWLADTFKKGVNDPGFRQEMMDVLQEMGLEEERAQTVGDAAEGVHRKETIQKRKRTAVAGIGVIFAVLALMLKKAAGEEAASGGGRR